VFWASPGFSSRLGADPACVARQRVLPRSHDHLFHSTLGLLDLETVARDPALDMFAACRQSVVNMASRPASGRDGG
jgi:lipid A ethanolaminephosphotransferase